MEPTKRCQWCAEEILQAAIKCKHCGEMVAQPVLNAPLSDCPKCGFTGGTKGISVFGHLKRTHGLGEAEARQLAGLPAAGVPLAVPKCSACAYQPTSKRDAFLHEANVHTGKSATGTMTKASAGPTKPSYSGKVGGREKLSKVGAKSDAGLACPKCGGTQFTAKRSAKGKLIGFSTLGVGGLIAPKSQVKCVTCGTMFKRG